MEKKIYSLVLDDEVMRRIDIIANKKGKSRSSLINQVLAEYVGYETPVNISRNVLDNINEMLSSYEDFAVLMQESTLLLRSALSYKYNPTVKYSLEITDTVNKNANFRVNVRSRNCGFIDCFEKFITAWFETEKAYIHDVICSYSDGRYERLLRPVRVLTNEDAANAMGMYIKVFDASLKDFFAEAQTQGYQAGYECITENYRQYLKQNGNILL